MFSWHPNVSGLTRLKEARSGTLEEKRFFTRHHGRGPVWQTIEQLFDLTVRKEGFQRFGQDETVPATFLRPMSAQRNLFS